jgi:hypothetical protein
MKKTQISLVFYILIFSIGCSTKKTYILDGEIENSTRSILTVDVYGKKVTGKLYYPQTQKTIKISGELKNSNLNLSEIDDNNHISGYFIGTFDQNKYEGRWTAPKGESSAKFKYIILDSTSNLNNKIKATPKSDDKILLAYQNWVFQMVRSGEYCYEKEWHANREKHEKEGESYNGGDGKNALPDDLGYVKYGYINTDKKIDAWADIYPIYDMDGTWSNTAGGIHLFFLSNSKGEYDVISEPDIFDSGAKGGVDTILPNGIIIYEGLDYQGDDARCCPSKSWKTQYQYKGNRFVRIK